MKITIYFESVAKLDMQICRLFKKDKIAPKIFMSNYKTNLKYACEI